MTTAVYQPNPDSHSRYSLADLNRMAKVQRDRIRKEHAARHETRKGPVKIGKPFVRVWNRGTVALVTPYQFNYRADVLFAGQVNPQTNVYSELL